MFLRTTDNQSGLDKKFKTDTVLVAAIISEYTSAEKGELNPVMDLWNRGSGCSPEPIGYYFYKMPNHIAMYAPRYISKSEQ